jgi:hypothetical protein
MVIKEVMIASMFTPIHGLISITRKTPQPGTLSWQKIDFDFEFIGIFKPFIEAFSETRSPVTNAASIGRPFLFAFMTKFRDFANRG